MTGTTPTFTPSTAVDRQEIAAFQRLLPRLRLEHGGEYIAIHEGQILACAETLEEVCQKAIRLTPDRAVYCGWVEPIEDGVAFFSRIEVADEPVILV